MITTIIKEYGFKWLFYRVLYAIKLYILNLFPATERLYERKVEIKDIDIFKIDVKAITTFLHELPNELQEEIIKEANLVITGKIKAFSSKILDYNNPMNWHYNPLTKMETDKNQKWYRIEDFDPQRGDIKVIWEPSRFSHFYILLRAYMLTNEIKYYIAYSEQLESWVKNNQYSYGANYKDGQEASIRMINIMIAFTVFSEYDLTTEADRTNTFKIIDGSYRKVLSNFNYAYKSIKNNHTLSELNGMIIGSLCSQDKRRERKAFRLLNEVIDEQFSKDGGYIQKSFNYQRFALQMLEVSLKLEEMSNNSILESNKNKIKSSINLLFQSQQSNGMVPNYGHNDGALIFPLTSCDFTNYKPVLNSINILLEGERLYEPGIYDEEALWFNDGLLPDEFTTRSHVSARFDEAGLYINRIKDTFLFSVLNNFQTRPAHMDQLHFELWHKNVEIFSDQGTYSYSSDLGKQNILNSSHNTVEIKGATQMNLKGAFFIYNWTKRDKVEFGNAYFSGGYCSGNNYTHKRELKLSKTELNIIDYINSDKDDVKRVVFHTPCKIKVNNKVAQLFSKGEVIAEIITDEDFIISDSSRSKYYFRKETISKIAIVTKNDEIHTKIRFY